MSISPFDQLHAKLRSHPLAWRLVVGTRILLCAGFLPTGIVKMLGQPFTVISTETPIGLFFHAMHQSGLYWQFLGAVQVVASILLLIPAAAHLGAMIFFPVILNIFVITVSMDFKGTPAVTGLMLLASLLLVAWDYHRWRGLLTTEPLAIATPEPRRLSPAERVAYAAGAVCGLTFFLTTRGLAPSFTGMPSLIGAALSMLAALALAARRPWRDVRDQAAPSIVMS